MAEPSADNSDERFPAAEGSIHGASDLPGVRVDTYNWEKRVGEGFLGDRASKRAFKERLDRLRRQMRQRGADPFGDISTDRLYKDKQELDRILISGDPEAAGVLLGAIEQFALRVLTVLRRMLETAEWRGAERIVVGGGFRQGRLGELAIGRTAALLKACGIGVDLVPIRHHPEQAGLLGGVHLAPRHLLRDADAILAVDIGGTNIRVGIVAPCLAEAPDLSRARVVQSTLWRHADDRPDRETAVDHLVRLLRDFAARAESQGMRLAPFIAVACPGIIRPDGTIDRGAQNLPGDWTEAGFNLAGRLRGAVPELAGRATVIRLHNDAVVQGLSELPFMQDVVRWGVLTIGTGLGNARFTNLARNAEERVEHGL